MAGALSGLGRLAANSVKSVVPRMPVEDYVRGLSKIIPGETKSGQLQMFSTAGRYGHRMPRATTPEQKEDAAKRIVMRGIKSGRASVSPPFGGATRGLSQNPGAAVRASARREEVAAKRRKKATTTAPPATTLEDDYIDWLFGATGR
jgi:hypothetical protein